MAESSDDYNSSVENIKRVLADFFKQELRGLVKSILAENREMEEAVSDERRNIKRRIRRRIGWYNICYQASPITTEQCTTSSCPSTTTAVRVTPVIVSTVTTAPGTVTTVPGVTMAPGSLCTKCDIAAIAPAMEANTVFENTNTVGPDGGTQTNAICRRTDAQVCTVTLSATNAAGTSTISSAMNANQVSGLLTCQADGTYSSGSVTGITKLVCTFDTCVPACTTCDTESDSTPAGQTCKRYSASCHSLNENCSPNEIYAEIGTGGEVLLNSVGGSDTVTAAVDCGNDAKLTFMGM
ncbi:hypothetical protein GCK72_021663 [Caenorhabditis remanei]|uniref:DUF281 domain-containing protein n=1 Tax=Caenorhabditis remanei TaxID=31234 RepID=A0A6A5GKP1_CAERE|nr:hypothetical protein GCK72_021663 [Caenorhabditis remanei]KAF1755095.1 hypothetical protein GCK72_021663 [Caenorhabditis remanei]